MKSFKRNLEMKSEKRKATFSRDTLDEMNAYHRAWRRVNPMKYWLSSARRRANRLKVPFDLQESDLKPLPKKCPVLGLALDYNVQERRGMSNPNRATLDRVDPKKGYVKGNVKIISARANRLKSDATRRELSAVWKYVEKNRGK